jgi:MFS transporter, PPP family, 3-phenylpropionic acid transporter
MMSGRLPYWRLSNFYFWYFAFAGVFATYFSLYLQSIALTPEEIGVLMSLFPVVRVVTPNLWGWLSDHSGRRLTIIRHAFLASTLAYLGVFAGRSFWWLFVVIIVMSSFWSATMPLFEATVMTYLGGEAARYGRIRLWGSIGFIVAVATAGWWLDHVPIAWLLGLVLALMLVTLACTYTVREKPVAMQEHDRVPVWQVLRRPEVLTFFLACFLMLASQGASYVFYSIYMVEQGYSKTIVGVLWSIGVIAEITIFLYLPRVFARFTHYQLWVLSFAVTVLRYLVVGWFPQLLGLQVLAQVMHMFTFGTFHATALAVLHANFTGRLQTRGQGLYTSLSFGLGGAIGGLISGYTWTHWGAAWTFTLSSGMALAGLLLVLAKPQALIDVNKSALRAAQSD